MVGGRFALWLPLPYLTGVLIWVAEAWRWCVAAGSSDPSLRRYVAKMVRGGNDGHAGWRCGWPGHGCSMVLVEVDRGHGGPVITRGVLSGCDQIYH